MRDRTAILSEGWDILEQALVQGRVAYEGTHFSIPETPLVAFPGAMPPVFLAGGEPGLWQRAARAGGHIFISQGHRRAAAALPMRAKIVAGLQAGGAHADALKLAIQRYVFVTDDAAEARQAAAGMLRFMRTTLSLRDAVPPRDGAFMRNVPFEGEPSVDWLLQNAPIGPAQKVVDLLGEDLELLAPSHWSLYMGFSGLPAARVLAAVGRFSTHVLPALRSMAPVRRQLAS
jgi:alkanesulfonate monooxygenase SsuD/methylene tetrahydromethanopterin reductase-like flavin-dependent oxidoreductase (luciferase family)